MSLLVGQTVMRVATPDSGYTGPQVAVAMALFGGIIAIAIGMVRLGILVDFIPGKYSHIEISFESHGSSKSDLFSPPPLEPAIAGFMSGSAITIAIGQYPKL